MSDTRILHERIADDGQRLQPWRVDDAAPGINANHVETTPLTDHARSCLLRCRQCVMAIQQLAGRPCIEYAADDDPLFRDHDRCAAMAQAVVHLAQTLPSDRTIQARLSEGLEGLLEALGDYIAAVRQRADRTERVNEQHASLMHLLTGLISGSNLALGPFTALADAVVTDARQGEPLQFVRVAMVSPACDVHTGRTWLAKHVAAHSLNVAFVAARVAANAPHFADQPMSLILGALLHDVGMLELPFELIAMPTVWTTKQIQRVHDHAARSAAIIDRHLLSGSTLLDAIRRHHVRLDDGGYPTITGTLSPLAKLLAACDVYAALRNDRPHRAAWNIQQTATEMALMVRRGQLDADAVAIVLRGV